MKRTFFALMVLLIVTLAVNVVVTLADSYTTNYHLVKPSRGGANWDTKINANFDTIDSAMKGVGDAANSALAAEAAARAAQDAYLYEQILLKYGDLVARLGNLPEIYVTTDTFNGPTGTVLTLPKTVDSITEYAVAVEPTSRNAAIGDIYVTQGLDNATIHCAETNTTDGFKAIILYRDDLNPYGTAIHRKWYVSPLDDITDHCDNTTVGSLAWIADQVGEYYATVELPGNHEYVVNSNCTISSNINLVFQSGAMLSPASGKAVTVERTDQLQAANHQQIFTGEGRIVFDQPGVVYANWWGAIGDGITDDTAAVEAAITACPATGCTLRLTQTYRIVDDVSIPTKTRVDFTPAGKLSIDSTYTVTFVSPSYITAANNQQIFDGGGTVEFTLPGIVYANWWGAKEDATDAAGTTDAIQAAITAAAPVPTAFDYDDRRQHAGTVRLACGHYLIDQPLKMPNNVVGLTLESECGAMHGFGQTAIQWAGTNMTDADDWMIDAGSVMGFRLKGIHLIGNADDDNATSPCIQNGVFVRRVNTGFFSSGNMWEDVTIRRFPGIGVQFGDYTVINSGTGDDSTNTDNSYVKNLMIQDCRVGMVLDSPNFVQVLFDRLYISNYGGNPVDDDNVTPIESESACPVKFRTKNAVQILHGKLHAVDAYLYASYADTDDYSQYAIYALNGSFNVLSGYSESRFLAYVVDGDETQGQQEVNSISNFHLYPGTAGGPATDGKYPIYYAKSYLPLLLFGTKNIWVMEGPTSAGVVSVGCQVQTKFLSRYMVSGDWWDQYTRNPNSYDFGLMTMTHNLVGGESVLRWNISTQIGAAGTSFDSPDGKTFRLLNNLIRSTTVDENGTETTVYNVLPGEQPPGETTTAGYWDFGEEGIIAKHMLGAIPGVNMTEEEIAANSMSQLVWSASPGAGELNIYNGWAEYDGDRKVGARFGLDRRQITFWGELDGSGATSDAILVISGMVDCAAIGLTAGEKFYVAANGNGEFLPLSFTCGTSEGADYLTLAHGDWPEDENSTRIDRVSLDGITIFVK